MFKYPQIYHAQERITILTEFKQNINFHVKNLSAYWLPEFTLQRVISGTIYSVSGSYEGTETLDKKLQRILIQQDIESNDSLNQSGALFEKSGGDKLGK